MASRLVLIISWAALSVSNGAAWAQQQPGPLDRARNDPDAQAQGTGGQAGQPTTDIVPDTQFDAQLPPLEPALNAQLEPVDQAPMPVEASPATPPDPALSQPLPPIASFDVTLPADANDQPPEKAPTIRYATKVEGLDKVGLESRFRSLSALDKGDGQAANGAVISARAREDEALALRILKADGYYDAAVTSLVEPVPDQPNRVRATITAAAGPRYHFRDIAISGPATVPPGIARDALGLKSGDAIVADAVQGAEAAVSLKLPQRGYPFVKLGERDIVLADRSPVGDYTLPVDPGPRSSFGGFANAGETVFDTRHVALLSRFKPGELYDSRRVEDLREAMVATGLLSSVAVEPQRTGRLGPDGTETVDLIVRQQKGPDRTLAASAGYATGEGFKLQGSWTDRNLFPPEGALILDAVLGSQEQGVGATFRRSNAGRRDRTVQIAARALHENYAAYEAFTTSLIGRISRDSTPIWQKRWTYAYGFELIASNETRADPTRRRDDGTYLIAALPGQIGYDRSDNILNPTRGFRVGLRLSPEFSQRVNAGGGRDYYLRSQLDASGYYRLARNIVIAGRARFGSIVGASRDAIAPSRRLYAGGGGSVRGFGYQELGPRDTNNDPLGGRGLTEFAVEARYRFGNYGIVPFIDAGQVTEASTPGFNALRYGAGIGGRLYTNFGPLRIDVATPINRRKGEAKIALYLSIGQAF